MFLTDVSKQTMDDLITFIYSGEVNVEEGDLASLLNTAKALKIKGLLDDCYAPQASNSTWTAPAFNRSQYQSTRTIRIQNRPPTSDFTKQKYAFEHEKIGQSQESNAGMCHTYEDDHFGDDMVNEGLMKQDYNNDQNDTQSDMDLVMNLQQNRDPGNVTIDAPETKRFKSNIGEMSATLLLS